MEYNLQSKHTGVITIILPCVFLQISILKPSPFWLPRVIFCKEQNQGKCEWVNSPSGHKANIERQCRVGGTMTAARKDTDGKSLRPIAEAQQHSWDGVSKSKNVKIPEICSTYSGGRERTREVKTFIGSQIEGSLF